MANVKNAKNKNLCHDCKKEIKVNGKDLIEGVFLSYKSGIDEYKILKCDECFEKNPGLTNYQPCEVYSRIVGYIRPIQQWNPSKIQEYSERREFNLKKHATAD